MRHLLKTSVEWRFWLDAVALGLTQLVSLQLGLLWQQWTSISHPTAVLIPWPFLMGCVVWSLWCRATLVPKRDQARYSAIGQRLAWTATAVCCGLYLLTGVAGAKLSAGRIAVVALWALSGASVSLLLHRALCHWSLSESLRKPWPQRILALGAGLLTCTVMIGLMELVSGLLIARQPAAPSKVYEGDYLKGSFFKQDPDLGIALQPSRNVNCRLMINGGPLWDVSYGTDEFGRRRTLCTGPAPASRFAAFFGCSFLFGEGAADSQTIPSEFARQRPEYLALNYGVPGWGTQHMLALLESGQLPSQIPLTQGVGIYLYLPDVHEARVIGDMDIINNFGAGFPCYSLDAAGEPVRRGTFHSAQPAKLFVYGVLGASRTRQLMGLNFPARRPDHYRLTASLIVKSRQLFQKQFPGSDFLVVAFPSKTGPSLTLTLCRESGLRVLDLTGLLDAESPRMQYVGDGHPTPAANTAVAEAIADALDH